MIKKNQLILFHQLPIRCSNSGKKIYAKLDKKNKQLTIFICHTETNFQLLANYAYGYGYNNKFNIIIPDTNYRKTLPPQKLFNCSIKKSSIEYMQDGCLECVIKYTNRRFI
jgi:hypothetical protein